MYPIATQTVHNIVYSMMSDRVDELIEKISDAPDDEALVQRLKDQKSLIFFRVSVITDQRTVLYDNYTKRMLGPRFDKNLIFNHPEVEEAFEEGVGYYEGFSKLLNQQFIYLATAFDFHGKTYVLRTAFPYKFVADMTHDFKMGFLGVSFAVLSLFSLMIWFVIQYLTRPIHQIITAIKPFQEGIVKTLPEIKVDVSPEDDFGKLASTLNALSAKIQSQFDSLNKLLEMRKDFIANASHELKTPITVIRGFAETLHDHPDLPPETAENITEKIVQNSKRMTSLIKDLLTLSDIENIPQSRLIECDIYSIVQDCISTVREVYPEANIVVQNTFEGNIVADPSLMELAIGNLLENAAKYSKSPAKISVIIEQEGDFLKLKIADQGIGIPEKDLERVFERFYTVDKAHSKKLGGSGLGLSIVRTIVEKHFGKIEVSSILGKGSVFVVKLPIR